MTLWIRGALLLSLAACQPSSPAEETSVGGETTDGPDETTDPTGGELVSGACPASFAQGGGRCDAASSPAECTYPEGSCRCATTGYCGGVDPGPDWEPAPPTWRCDYGADTTRPDGCPGHEPETGDFCQEPDKICSYGDCCMSVSRCIDGGGETGGPQCPP